MKTEEFNFDLPERFIAQSPATPRDSSKLLCYSTSDGAVSDRAFSDIEEYLVAGDVLVLNKSKVFPARILFEVDGKTREVFVLDILENGFVKAMVRPGKFFKLGKEFAVADDCLGVVKEVFDDGTRLIAFSSDPIRYGVTPLPPYIHNSEVDADRYQTVYADSEGSVAAPTAGLHFTPQLIDRLRTKGVLIVEVVLHVGRGTFLPVNSENIDDHVMHEEFFEISNEACDVLNAAVSDSRRIVAVGTTSVRVLESAFDGGFVPKSGTTDIFIYPGKYKWKVVNALITNFHLPKSTLLMLVSSFLENKGVDDPVDTLKELYAHAMALDYRFYSFGDAMFLF